MRDSPEPPPLGWLGRLVPTTRYSKNNQGHCLSLLPSPCVLLPLSLCPNAPSTRAVLLPHPKGHLLQEGLSLSIPKGSITHARAPSALHQNFPAITYFLYRGRQQTLKTTNWFHLRWFQLTSCAGFLCDKECETAQKSARDGLDQPAMVAPSTRGSEPTVGILPCLLCCGLGTGERRQPPL